MQNNKQNIGAKEVTAIAVLTGIAAGVGAVAAAPQAGRTVRRAFDFIAGK